MSGNVQDMSRNADEQAVKLEESAKRIDELMQERAGFERTITELQGRLKEQRKTHQGTLNSILEIVPVVDDSLV
jgi:uncharacterized coiled-coil DUF342 family protein